MKTFRLIGTGLMAVLLCFAFTACDGDDEEDNENKEPSKYNAVDLGLPSGTLWADRNIGADFPEDSGDYFAWGETATKDYFDLDTSEDNSISFDASGAINYHISKNE